MTAKSTTQREPWAPIIVVVAIACLIGAALWMQAHTAHSPKPAPVTAPATQ